MKRVTYIQIVARMSPHVDGVGDYALELARAMRRQYGVETVFLACSLRETQDRSVDGFAVHVFKSYDAEALVDSLRQIASSGPVRLIYHLSGYGYSPDGAPVWQVEGLRQYLHINASAHLATIFHELYARSLPWRRAFWHAPRQRRVSRSLAHMSDQGLCTLERNQRVLRRWAPELALTRLAIPSNIPAPSTLMPWSERSQRMAIFGLPGNRARAYADGRALQRVCAALGITQICDIGPQLSRAPKLPGVQIAVLGAISAEDVSAQLMNCRFGYLDYTAQTLAKSGVMAAYCAHALVPVIPVAGVQACDGLAVQRTYLAADTLPVMHDAALASIAAHAQAWHASHDVPVHAQWCYAKFTDS